MVTVKSMTVPTIIVTSRLEAADILNSQDACAELSFLLSIGEQHDQLPVGYENVAQKLRLLGADDVSELGASAEDVWQIIRLAEKLRFGTGRILIHCEAGVRRSTAAALIMYACWLGPGREAEAMDRVLIQRPIAVPNRRMVEIADRLLEREGRLLAVLG